MASIIACHNGRTLAACNHDENETNASMQLAQSADLVPRSSQLQDSGCHVHVSKLRPCTSNQAGMDVVLQSCNAALFVP
jgi:hypothetical protein